MAPAARPRHLPAFALKLVRARARELSRQRIIPAYERRDIEQHFLLELWRRWRRFDGSRGGLPGFVVRSHRQFGRRPDQSPCVAWPRMAATVRLITRGRLR